MNQAEKIKVLVFGASGATGVEFVRQALFTGHFVTVVVRNPDAFMIWHDHVKVIKGDVLYPNTFDYVMGGNDVVVSCLGSRERRPTTVYSEGMRNIVTCMEKNNVRRLIGLSAAAVVVPPDATLMMKFLIRNVLQPIFRNLYVDMLLMEKIMADSDLNWSVIRPPRLTTGLPTGTYRTSINKHLYRLGKINRADLADFILKSIGNRKTFKSTIEISY